MTKRNIIIVIILLSVIDLVAAGWYMSRRIETGDKSEGLFGGRDSSDVITEADTVVTTSVPDMFDKLEHSATYYIANSPSVSGDKSTCYTSIKHVKLRWPLKVNGSDVLESLNKALVGKAFGNSHSQVKDARYMYLKTPSFNKPMGDDYRTLNKAPLIVPVYGNVSQVLVYPYMTSNRLLVMEIDKVEYNGHATLEDNFFIHYDRGTHRVLSRIDILSSDISNENKLLKLINKKIDNLNRSRGESNHLQHALNVPAELCCGKNGIIFQFRQGSISSGPVAVQVDYDDLKSYLTPSFTQLMEGNGDYQVFKDDIKPEAVNPSRQQAASASLSAPVSENKSGSNASGYHKKSYKKNYYKKSRYNSYYKKNSYYNKGNGYHRSDSASGSKKSYKGSGYSGYKHRSFKQGYRSQKQYSGAKRRSGRYGYSGKRHWSRRRR